MLIGIPRETPVGEQRVAIIPSGVPELLEVDYEVIVEAGAGEASTAALKDV